MSGACSASADSVRPLEACGADEDVSDDEGEDAVGGSGAQWRKIADPRLPSAEGQRMRNLTHVPYRSWCHQCVRGRGKKLPHGGVTDKERTTIASLVRALAPVPWMPRTC